MFIILAVLLQTTLLADARESTGGQPHRRKKSSAMPVEFALKNVPPYLNQKIYRMCYKVTTAAKKQVSLEKNCNGKCSGKAQMHLMYRSLLLASDVMMFIDVNYTEAKEFYTDKIDTKKYIVRLSGDQATFSVVYDAHHRKYSLKYFAPDTYAKKPTQKDLELELNSALDKILASNICLKNCK